MTEIVSITFAILSGLVSWGYAHRAYRLSVQAPVLRFSFCHPDTKQALPAFLDPRREIQISLSADDYESKKKEAKDNEKLGFPLPFIIRNTGTRTAKKIIVHARYSPVFTVQSNGKQIEDGDRSQWLVVEHVIQDIHPKQSYTFYGDMLYPDEKIALGFLMDVPATTKDNVKIVAKLRVRLSALIEVVVFSEDGEPIVRRAKVVFTEDDKDKELTK